MTRNAPHTARWNWLLTLGMFTALLHGCGGDHFGSELSAKPRPRPMGRPEGVTLRLPREHAFNIVLPSATQKSGLNGTAKADATAEPDGHAQAVAAVTHSGTAEGLFRLGHALVNDTERQVDVDFNVRLHYEFDAQSSSTSRLPDARVGLRLYVRDDSGVLLRDVSLMSYTTENGSARRAADEHEQFTLTLGPRAEVSVFLAGRAGADISEGRSASATLTLSNLRFEVVTRPAPAVRTAGDEQP